MKRQYLYLLLMFVVLASCDLEQLPESTASKSAVFGSESGLKLYTNSFYGILPNRGTHRADDMSDYLCRRDVPTFVLQNAYSAEISSGWSWGDLRNSNHFIVNNYNEAVTEATSKHSQGIGRFLRVYFYSIKVKRFGDVAWVCTQLDVDYP